jgi:hypothetical protein
MICIEKVYMEFVKMYSSVESSEMFCGIGDGNQNRRKREA